MQNYELRCRKLSGEYVVEKLGEFEGLLEALESVTCGLDLPLPDACQSWAVLSDDGMELAAKRS